MKLSLKSFLRLLTCAAVLLSALAARAEDKKADPTGTWSWTMNRPNGGEGREVTLKIKKEGDKYMGTMSGARGNETKLENVKVMDDQISFSTTFERNGNSFTTKYSGKISGDSITGKTEFERNGEKRSRDWMAKRKKE